MVPSKGLRGAALQGRYRSDVLLSLGVPDAALKGGLGLGELHELAPFAPFHSGASLGFALALSTLVPRDGPVVWVQQDFAGLETGTLYGLGCDLFGLASSRLLVVRTATPRDTLWATEEAVKTRGVAAGIGERLEEGQAAHVTANRPVPPAAHQIGGRLLLLPKREFSPPSSPASRW